MRFFGRALQAAGLMILPLGLVSLTKLPIYLFASLGFGVSMFLIGRLLEGYAGSGKNETRE